MASAISSGGGISQATADAAYVPLTSYLTSLVSTQFDKTNNTLANVTGLSLTLLAATRYVIRVELALAYGAAAGGFKIGLGGTATKTSCSVDYLEDDLNGGAPGFSQQTRIDLFGSSIVGTPDAVFSSASHVTIIGTFVSNAAGTLTVQFAQSSTNATASSVLVGSSFVAFK
jgi:hypothetical protein